MEENKITSEKIERIREQARIMREFKKTEGWKIMSDIIDIKMQGKITKLLHSEDINEVCRLQGAINELDRVLNIPDDFIGEEKRLEEIGGE